MAVGSVNYGSPVRVNGFSCNNCSEVSLATKGIDPAHPRSGVFNRDAAIDPTRNDSDPVKVAAAKKSAEATMREVVGYSMTGAVGGVVAPGRIVSITA